MPICRGAGGGGVDGAGAEDDDADGVRVEKTDGVWSMRCSCCNGVA